MSARDLYNLIGFSNYEIDSREEEVEYIDLEDMNFDDMIAEYWVDDDDLNSGC
jgi:hypothetical protein